MSPILKAEKITKKFPGVKALDEVSFDVYAGEVHAVMGENGAGKSTLMKILSGVYAPDEGQLNLDGKDIRFSTPKEAQNNGIAIIHQELNLIPCLSVAENIFLGREIKTPWGTVDFKTMNQEASELLEQLDLPVNPRTRISDLRVGEQQVVEIAKALSQQARIIIMDEPTSAISEHEIDILFERIQNMKNQGVAILYITHKMDEVFRIAERITVLRDGGLIESRMVKGLSEDEIICMMVGRTMDEFYVRPHSVQPVTRFRADNLKLIDTQNRPLLNEISFSVNQGEVLGIFGLMGAGRTELLETIFGLHPDHASGCMTMDENTIAPLCPADAIEAGLALVPEDRKLAGLILEMSVEKNVSLAGIEQITRFGLLNQPLEKKLASDYVKQLNIKAHSCSQQADTLSGGNQQKVVLSKWLATRPKILLLDEPTRGIDINAKNEIYQLIGKFVQSGMGVIMVSSELPEILRVANRILVMCEGRITGEFNAEDASEESLLKAALPGNSVKEVL